jgi:ferredoxin
VEIYYFSGTGNSLSVARRIAERTGARLIPIASIMGKDSIEPQSGAIGIVFPVYFATNDCGIPLIVGRFIGKLKNLDQKYIFAVCTCGSMPGTTLENLGKVLGSRGGELAAGFAVRMGNKKLVKEKQQRMSDGCDRKIATICETVSARRRAKLETRSSLGKLVFAPLLFLLIRPLFSMRYRRLSGMPRSPFSKMIPYADRSFSFDEKCNGCGTCSRVCPVNNIEMVGDRPVWQHRCENCYGCYGWCPCGAIHGEIVSYNERYHHPDVKLSEMLMRSS